MSFSARCVHAAALFSIVLAIVPAGFGSCAVEAKAADVEIRARPASGRGPLWVSLAPKVKNLKGPLTFHWFFGDGEESAETVPKRHYYDFGKYNLMLEVTDGDGKAHTAAITIDAALPG